MHTDRTLSDAGRVTQTLSKGALSRRTFITSGAAVGGGLLLGIGLHAPGAAAAGSFAPNAFVRIDRDGKVTLIVGQVEMG